MAEMETDLDSFQMGLKSLYCSICYCLFKEPKVLPCQHSFCHHCLKSYIVSKDRKLGPGENLVVFPCPVCQMDIRPGNDDLSAEDWAGTFPTNFTLASLKDELLSEKNRKQRQPVCTVHQKKRIKFFCSDCNSLLCSLCTAKAHKTCRPLKTLPEAVGEITVMKLKLSKQLIRRKTELEEVCLCIKKLMISMLSNKQTMIRNIQSETGRIVELLKEFREREREAVSELEDLHSTNQLALEEALAKCKSSIDSINFCQNLIDQSTFKEVTDAAFLQRVSTANQKFKELPDKVPLAPLHQVLIFEPDTRLQKQLERLIKQPLGKVFLKQQLASRDQRSYGNATFVSTKTGTALTDTIADTCTDFSLSNVSNITTMNNSSITDVALLPDGFLVITDSLSRKVKILKEDGELVREIQLSNPPWGVCRLIQGEIAVTVPSKENIIFLSNVDTLSIQWEIMTTKKYLGIVALYRSVLVCASAAYSCVDIISTCGEIYQSFNRNFVHPTYVALTKEYNILVTDSSKKAVICCDHRGNELFRYTGHSDQGLTDPAGICTNQQGSVFVADVKNHNIYKIQILPLFTNIQQPSLSGLAISSDKLVLTHNDIENKISGISIFHK